MRNRRKARGGKQSPGGANSPRPNTRGVNNGARALGQAASRPGSAPPNGFTMRDEARNTASHMNTWGQNDMLRQNVMLRQRPVAFVSAGFVEPLKDIEPVEESKTSLPAEHVNKSQAAEGDAAVPDTVQSALTSTNDMGRPRAMAGVEREAAVSAEASSKPEQDDILNPQTPSFFFDLTGDKTIGRPAPEHANPESTSDVVDSSDEVILFKGRGKQQCNARGDSSAPAAKRQQRGSTTRSRPCRQPRLQTAKQPASDSEEDVEDAILKDYIANMAADSDDGGFSRLQTFNTQRELGGESSAMGSGPADTSPPGDDILFAKEDNNVDPATSGASGEANSDSDMDMDMDDEALARLMKQQKLGPPVPNLASAAEASDEMDMRSWDHPQLLGRRKERRRKDAPDFGAPDSDMERHLKASWENDRERKKARKMEREALRASGLLGKHGNPDDLRVKYLTGMTLDEVKQEFLVFLLGSEETTQFPPMDKNARKVLHELANRFNIKSQSTGKGDQRRPVLYRTKRTFRYGGTRAAEATRHVDEAATWIRRKYFHRLDAKGKPQPGPAGSGGGSNAVRYRDGEIAGASIPELGQENKGRAMLEKMGWAKGTGLGAIENKGILEPVAQVVKSSKAGLG